LGQRRSPELVAKCYQLTAAVLKSAVRDRLIAVNPCDGVRLPRRRKQDHQGRVISQDELLTKLLPAAPERYRALIATAAGTGLRWGEVAGLCLDAVDLAAGRLYVIRTVVEVSGHTAFKPYPKSAAGRRTIPLPRWLTEIIANHLASYALGVEQLVFPNTVVAPLRRTLFRARVWKPTLLRAGLDSTLRFHDLRHSYATWLVDDGVPVNVVQRVMGHERSSTTLDLYTRRSDGEDRILRALGALDEAGNEEVW
jgi:integrase